MCTAIKTNSYAGRNLDVEKSYGEKLITVPRHFPLTFKLQDSIDSHYAFIGIGAEEDGYPLYFDAANEKGLYVAGLNYVKNAKYHHMKSGCINLAPYELILYLLATCSNIKEAVSELGRINITDIPFKEGVPLSELHFFIADNSGSITAEPDKNGIKIYDNPVGVLTNNPSFPLHLHNLKRYAALTNEPIKNSLLPPDVFDEYSRGMGALGLPGDLSSESRFVRAAFHRLNSVSSGSASDLFHLLSSVEMPLGSLRLGDSYEYTAYSSAVDLTDVIYSYRLYESFTVRSVKLSGERLDADKPIYRDL